MSNTRNKLLLIDGSSVAFRAFFALYNQIDRFKSEAGFHTNAIYGFHLMLSNLLERLEPTHVLVAFDAGKTTFRTKMYEDYKGGRAKTPDEFREQIPMIKQLIEVLGMKHYELVDYEADDIIGTLDKMAEDPEAEDFEVIIVTGDKDMIQLVDANTTVEISKKGVTEFESWTPAYLKEKMGLTPSQFIDLKALMGDASDNYPGVTKVGEKTALQLLRDWGSLDNLYDHVDTLKTSKMKENLIADKDSAYLSQKLATIKVDSPIEISLSDLIYSGPVREKLLQFYDDMGFRQFKEQFLAGEDLREGVDQKNIIPNLEVIEARVGDLEVKADDFFYLEILGDNYHEESIIGFSWGNKDKQYVSKNLDLLQDFPWPDNTYDFKKNLVLLDKMGLVPDLPKFDAMLAKYLVSTTEDNKISTIAHLFGQERLAADEEVYGKGAKLAIPDDQILFSHLAAKIKVLSETKSGLLAALKENEQEALLTEMELPLAKLLAKMEIAGIAVEEETLRRIGEENEVRLASLTQEIYNLAGSEFNVNSPRQLGEVLFDQLKIQGDKKVKKTKTGYSTAVSVLESYMDETIVVKILEYRQLAKVQSTYVQGLIPQIAEDGRIHTRYVQDLTQTGRLSSVDPNLQNIPIRLEDGRKIRKAFVPSIGNVLLSSDYSQIELRVLAHISEDETLITAFQEGADIHTSTAMQVFNIQNPEKVTANDRRNAKAVNFGISYGETEYGLAKRLGIPSWEAAEMIRSYFDRYQGVAAYITRTKREAKDKGYVSTIFNRRRKIPEINSRNFMIRQGAERQAINAPIQGSAGDILKVAMINLDQALSEGGFKSQMLLQVHDEIVLDVPKKELEAVSRLVKETMESALILKVPLVADENIGDTWYEAK